MSHDYNYEVQGHKYVFCECCEEITKQCWNCEQCFICEGHLYSCGIGYDEAIESDNDSWLAGYQRWHDKGD